MRSNWVLVAALVVAWSGAFSRIPFGPSPAQAAPGDTTWVQTFQNEFHNWADHHQHTFAFPAEQHWRKVLLRYRIGCPGAPGDCDPWDRIGYLQLQRDAEMVEIARVITPYDITGGNRPGSCTWTLDVSDYQSLLHGQVTLDNYIESWIGGNRGWLVTVDFAFIEGEPAQLPYQVINLWNNYYAVYGDPTRPIEDVLSPRSVPIDAEAIAAKVKVTTTGHGQGNTGNCAEFCSKTHSVVANAVNHSHTLWRANCSSNTCSPQGGTWTLPRAGWCPGDKVDPWDVDVTADIVAGQTATLDYDVTPYTNFCCPCNPSCISGQTCSNCQYDSNGHTEPIYAVASQLILYRTNPAASVADGPARVLLGGNAPNPFHPQTEISYSLASAGTVRLSIFDAGGRKVRTMTREHAQGGEFRISWDGRDDQGLALPSGVYFYSADGTELGAARKMLLVE